MNTRRPLPAVLAGAVCWLALALGAAGQDAPAALPSIPRSVPAREIPVEATAVRSEGWPFKLHTSMSSVHQVAADPKRPQTLWMGTEGGLFAYDTDTGRGHRWTLAEGLPGQAVLSLAHLDEKVHMVLGSGMNLGERRLGYLDRRDSHFRSWYLRGEGLPQPLHALRVLTKPGARGALWWVTRQGLLRQDVEAGFWTFFPAPVVPALTKLTTDVEDPWRLVDAVIPAKGRIFAASRDVVWELRPQQKEWRRVCDVQDLDLASPERHDRDITLTVRDLSAENGGEVLWVGAYHGLFHVETKSGRATWPEETRGDWTTCIPRRVLQQGERRFAFGNVCVREIGSAPCCALDRKLWEIRDAMPDSGQPDLLWLATRRGLIALQVKEDRWSMRRPVEPDGNDVQDLVAVDGRLWLGLSNADVSVLDPVTKEWKIISGVFNAEEIQRSSADGSIVAVSGGRNLVWIDPRTAEQVPTPGNWQEGSHWGFYRNLHHDERGLWLQGGKFVQVLPDGTFRTVREGPFGQAAHSFVPDPAHPGDFLVIHDGSLARLDSESGKLEVLRPGVEAIRLVGDRYLWIQGKPNARLDLRTGEVAALGLEGRFLPDTRNPDWGWLVRLNSVALYDVARGERLAAVTLPEDVLARSVVVLGDSAWVSTGAGLLEIPLVSLGTARRAL